MIKAVIQQISYVRFYENVRGYLRPAFWHTHLITTKFVFGARLSYVGHLLHKLCADLEHFPLEEVEKCRLCQWAIHHILYLSNEQLYMISVITVYVSKFFPWKVMDVLKPTGMSNGVRFSNWGHRSRWKNQRSRSRQMLIAVICGVLWYLWRFTSTGTDWRIINVEAGDMKM